MKLKAPRLVASTAQDTASSSSGAPVRTMTSVSGQRFLIDWQQFQSVAVGQLNVQQHQVGLFLRERLFQRRFALSLGD